MSFFHHPDHHSKKVVKSSVQNEASNRNVQPRIVNSNPYMKVPVVLGETTVQIDLDSIIDFPEPVLEIKRIKKNLKIVQCHLLLPTNKLFLKGFVRKNIQYATPRHSGKDYVSSSIHSLTVDVPFQVVTRIDLLSKPDFRANPSTTEFNYYKTSKLPKGFSSKERLLSSDFTEYNQISEEVYNELPYCELLSTRFIEHDEVLDREMGVVYDHSGEKMHAPFEEGTFTQIEEKMVIEVTLKVLQNQQVYMKDYSHKDGENWESS